MGSRIYLTILLVTFLALPFGAVDGLEVTVDTHIPEFILDYHLNLTGTTAITRGSWVETSNEDYLRGTTDNVSVSDGSVYLKPSLSFNILNGGNAVLKPGTGAAWDTVLITGFSVVKVVNTYYLYYVGSRGTSLMDARHIGLATSTDGSSWTKYSGNPILTSRVNSYDWTNLNNPIVDHDNGTWHMWYGGNHGNQNAAQLQDIDICYATSPDGHNWTKSSSNPVMANGFAAWAKDALRPYEVLWNGSAFVIYYKARSAGPGATSWLGLATSTDGVTWSQDPNNPLRRGDQNGWEDGEFECGTREMANGTHRMWTMGNGGPYRLGWVWSEDGIDWEDSGSAILSPKPNTIYANQIMYPKVHDEGDTYILWARCWDGTGYRTIGAFRATPKDLTGSYVSRRYDAGGVVNVTDVAWNGSIPGGGTGSPAVSEGGEYVVSLRWSNTTSSWSTWRRLDPMDDLEGLSATYFQYKVEFQAYQDWFRLSFDDLTLSYDVPITSVDISVDGAPWEPVMGTFGAWWLDLSLHDGDYDIRVRVIDAVGDQVVRTIPVKVDLYPPEGALILEEGRWATPGRDINYTAGVANRLAVTHMMLSSRSDMEGGTWEPYEETGTFPHRGLDGNVTVYCLLRKASGRVGPVFNDSIIVDTTPPEGKLQIDNGSKYTNSTDVTLGIDWWDLTGVEAMRVSHYPHFRDARWTEPVHEVEWTLLEGEGDRTVFVQLRDAVGWTTILTETIIMDTSPPDASVAINDDDEFTSSREVLLSIDLWTERPVEVDISNGGEEWEGAWTFLEDDVTMPWTLSAGDDGFREVLMRVRDLASNEITVSDDIVLDTTPPEGILTLVGNEGFVNSSYVNVNLEVTDALSGVHRMRLTKDPGHPWSPWQAVMDEFMWSLYDGEGQRNAVCEVRDRAGNVATLNASIVVDKTPPEGTITIDQGLLYTRMSDVDLELAFTDNRSGLDVMRVCSLPDLDWNNWDGYQESIVAIIGSQEGLRTVLVEVRDKAGNVGGANGTIILDMTPPEVTLRYVREEGMVAGVNEFHVDVFDEWDPSPIVEWRVDGGRWRALEGATISIDLSTGHHEIEVRAIDKAGNAGQLRVDDEVTMDYMLVTGWILLILVIGGVAAYSIWRERRTYQERLRDR